MCIDQKLHYITPSREKKYILGELKELTYLQYYAAARRTHASRRVILLRTIGDGQNAHVIVC